MFIESVVAIVVVLVLRSPFEYPIEGEERVFGGGVSLV